MSNLNVVGREAKKVCRSLVSFLAKHHPQRTPLLVALSGGVDSQVLYEAISRIAVARKAPLHVAHLDHSWRPSSQQEAARLKAYVESRGHTFHLKTLQPPHETSNLEALGRKERLRFFQEVLEKIQGHGVLVAHHADDQAESVLKRFLEGASSTRLSGMTPIATVEGVPLWRPFLDISKQTLAACALHWQLHPIEDTTNRDTKFLRARLREDVLPHLEESFGKKVKGNLCSFGTHMQELTTFVQEQVAPYLEDGLVTTQEEVILDLSIRCPTSPFLIKEVLRRFAQIGSITLSRQMIETLASWILLDRANKACVVSGKMLYLHRRRIRLASRKVFNS